MINFIKNMWGKWKAAQVLNSRYHISAILYLVVILVILCIALMYTEFLNNAVMVDMVGLGKMLRIPRVNAIMGSLGSWLGIPNINDALLLSIIMCILILVTIFILKILVGGVMNWLFLAIFTLVGRGLYMAVTNYYLGADMLYTNSLFGIHILRVIDAKERAILVQNVINSFFAKYEINQEVILSFVTDEDLGLLLDSVANAQTRQQIIYGATQ